jgi:carbonic anhydrase/acetyltransferase-like protein (isoleucine patch superfamily)
MTPSHSVAGEDVEHGDREERDAAGDQNCVEHVAILHGDAIADDRVIVGAACI